MPACHTIEPEPPRSHTPRVYPDGIRHTGSEMGPTVAGPEPLIGQRIRYWRIKRRRKQAVVAGLRGISVDYLSRVERGLKTPTLGVLVALARELDVPVGRFLDTDSPTNATASTTTPPDVARALTHRPAPGIDRQHPPAALRERVEAAWRIWQTSPTRFTEASAVLPGLITDIEDAQRVYRTGTDGVGRREINRCAADLYFLLRSYCRRTGRGDLGLLVADRAMRAAEDADDPIRIAAAQWNLGHMLLGNGEPKGAEDVARHGIEQPSAVPSTETVAMAGALELVTVVAQTRRRRWWDARDHLASRAAPKAAQVGEGNPMWTVFGPTNVELHAVSVDMEAGESADALRTADTVNTSQMPSIERHFTFLLEVARCYELRREDAAVLVHLLDLEQLAPEDLPRSPLARQMVTDLQRRIRPTYRRQVTELAERLGLN
jgi:transcriptional regulator with XRE-family HTH domain